MNDPRSDAVDPPLAVVGRVHSRHRDPAHTPIQPALNPDERAEVHIEADYLDAVDGLEGFDFLWLLSWLHRPGQAIGTGVAQRQVPFLLQSEATELGLFAMRGPRRPSPIGLHLVRLLAVEGAVLHIAGVDLLDGTAIVDIKPFVAAFDLPYGPQADRPRSGWFDRVAKQSGATPSSLGHTAPNDVPR